LIAVDETGRPQFYDLLRRAQAPAYVAFDLALGGWCRLAMFVPQQAPAAAAQAVLPEASRIVSEALSVSGRGRELFDLMCSNDLESIVAKRNRLNLLPNEAAPCSWRFATRFATRLRGTGRN
jgi:hypothetical protein